MGKIQCNFQLEKEDKKRYLELVKKYGFSGLSDMIRSLLETFEKNPLIINEKYNGKELEQRIETIGRDIKKILTSPLVKMTIKDE